MAMDSRRSHVVVSRREGDGGNRWHKAERGPLPTIEGGGHAEEQVGAELAFTPAPKLTRQYQQIQTEEKTPTTPPPQKNWGRTAGLQLTYAVWGGHGASLNILSDTPPQNMFKEAQAPP